jgi:hypothetical protein
MLRRDSDAALSTIANMLRPISLPICEGKAKDTHFPIDSGQNSPFNPFQNRARNLPAAAQCRAVGGMGTVWTGLAARFSEFEKWSLLSPAEWDHWYAEAEALLLVSAADPAHTPMLRSILKKLKPAEAEICAAEVAGLARQSHFFSPASPADFSAFDLIGGNDDGFTLMSQCTASLIKGKEPRANAVIVDELSTGNRFHISMGALVLAAGAIGNAQLLWTSGIAAGADSALGRNLTDHPLAFGTLCMTEEIESISNVDVADSRHNPAFAKLPMATDRRWLGYFLQDKFPLSRFEGRYNRHMLVNLYGYAMAAPIWENRVTFQKNNVDVYGLPQPTFDYSRPDDERELWRLIVEELGRLGTMLGTFLPSGRPRMLAAGSSMHLTGTHAASLVDDGRSVANDLGRVWGWENLYLTGPGLIAHPTATGPMLTSIALALRTCNSITNTTPVMHNANQQQ